MLRATYTFFLRKLRETARNPVLIFMSLMNPILYLSFYFPLFKNLPIAQSRGQGGIILLFLPGILTLLSFGTGLFAGFGFIDEIEKGVFERFCITPINRLSILVGMVLRDIFVASINVLLFIVTCLPLGFRIALPNLCILLLLLALLVATAASFSYTVALIAKGADRLAPILHGINMPLILLAGMMLPMHLAPQWLQRLAYVNPLYHIVEAARQLTTGGIMHATVGYAFLFMLGISAITLWWGNKVFARGLS